MKKILLLTLCLNYFHFSGFSQILLPPKYELMAMCSGESDFSIFKQIDCCVYLAAPNDLLYTPVSWDFGDGETSTSVSSVKHCFANTGTYLVTHNVTLIDGTVCSSSLSITVNTCIPCPQILNVTASITSDFPNTTIACQPSTSISPSDNNSTMVILCPMLLSPLLNVPNSSILNYKWEIFHLDPFTAAYIPECQTNSTLPNFWVRLIPYNIYVYNNYYKIRLTITPNTSNGCELQVFEKEILIPAQYPNQCNFQYLSIEPNIQLINNLNVIKKSDFINFYPNPVVDVLRISDVKYADNCILQIQNTLGQIVLTQQISSINAEINVSNLISGAYIGIIKSQGKIISTNKIYKQ